MEPVARLSRYIDLSLVGQLENRYTSLPATPHGDRARRWGGGVSGLRNRSLFAPSMHKMQNREYVTRCVLAVPASTLRRQAGSRNGYINRIAQLSIKKRLAWSFDSCMVGGRAVGSRRLPPQNLAAVERRANSSPRCTGRVRGRRSSTWKCCRSVAWIFQSPGAWIPTRNVRQAVTAVHKTDGWMIVNRRSGERPAGGTGRLDSPVFISLAP